MIKGSGKLKQGTRIQFEQGLGGEVEEVKDGKVKVLFSYQGEVLDFHKKFGHIPLPPYIKRKDELLDRDRYQTIFAERDGSIAAPTAGLHFTPSLLQSLRDKRVRTTTITLHIGIGTFAPVKVRDIEDHKMEAEWIEISEETAREIEQTKTRGGKIIAVGTTTTRVLESFCDANGGVRPGQGMTSLFIYPPYCFHVMVILLQEVARTPAFKVDEHLAERLNMAYVYSRANGSQKIGFEEGLGVFSRFPLKRLPYIRQMSQAHNPFSRRLALGVEVDTPCGEIVAFSAHLGLMHRQNAKQLREIHGWVNEISEGRSAIIAGDFNTTEHTRPDQACPHHLAGYLP